MYKELIMTYVVSATSRLQAPPRRVYDTIANYHTGHPRIVPRQFSNIVVEQGGVGAGTVIRFDMKVLGRVTKFRAEITEPEPGRVLVEKNVLGNDAINTFVVEPGAHANESVVSITTEMTRRAGIGGAIEQFIVERMLRPMYAEELRRLEAAAADPHGTATSTNAPA
jgi:Polyketide cyclase / dehydrase and lipid transport